MESVEAHWDEVWAGREPTEVGWYTRSLTRSLAAIEAVAPDREARIVDIGGGASTLVDDLLDAGYTNLTVVDVSRLGMAHARRRLGDRASRVDWVHADVRDVRFDEAFDVWHDRAVFHFLTEAADRGRYVAAMQHAIVTGGHAIIAAYGRSAPETCNGLPVVRYDGATLAAELGSEFRLDAVDVDEHITPSGAVHQYVYGVFTRVME